MAKYRLNLPGLEGANFTQKDLIQMGKQYAKKRLKDHDIKVIDSVEKKKKKIIKRELNWALKKNLPAVTEKSTKAKKKDEFVSIPALEDLLLRKKRESDPVSMFTNIQNKLKKTNDQVNKAIKKVDKRINQEVGKQIKEHREQAKKSNNIADKLSKIQSKRTTKNKPVRRKVVTPVSLGDYGLQDAIASLMYAPSYENLYSTTPIPAKIPQSEIYAGVPQISPQNVMPQNMAVDTSNYYPIDTPVESGY